MPLMPSKGDSSSPDMSTGTQFLGLLMLFPVSCMAVWWC